MNKEAARFSGLSVAKKLVQIYTPERILCGLAGLIYIARLNSAEAEMGCIWPLEAIAVCVIGGISFAGGEGNILGLLLGGIVMAIINNCINLLGIPPRFQDFFVGFVIILAVTVDHYSKKKTTEDPGGISSGKSSARDPITQSGDCRIKGIEI